MVSIQLLLLVLLISGMFQQLQCHCFNTTFVTVLCTEDAGCRRRKNVSIQLLLLFYSTIIRAGRPPHGVSIQLLLLFYLTPDILFVCRGSVSIQLLLLFYQGTLACRFHTSSFQYNFCYCSMEEILFQSCIIGVSIQLLLLFYGYYLLTVDSYYTVSIQLLLLFY